MTRLDPLRERLLAPELREARDLLSEKGAGALLALARRLVEEAESESTRFQEFSRSLESVPQEERPGAIQRHLRETTPDPKRLARDLRELKRGLPDRFDIGALAERAARRGDAVERRAEAAIAVARTAPPLAGSIRAADVLLLATTPGRWSRRVEALRWIAALARRGQLSHEARETGAALRELASASEHRWVQPAAVAAWAAIDEAAAHAFARERLQSDAGGDDFLVRSRLVALAAPFRKRGWSDLATIAEKDPRELVRMTAARVQPGVEALTRMARGDGSHRVRALALIALARRTRTHALPTLVEALLEDTHPFAVQTAAREIVSLARRYPFENAPAVREHLVLAASRAELPPSVRASCADALLEFDVLTTDVRRTYALLADAVHAIRPGSKERLESEILAASADEPLARALAVLARDDFAIGVDRTPRGAVIYRGEPRGFSAWRWLFELLHPGPSKRQAFDHTIARQPRGTLRAPPGGMAEVTATGVPGERVVVEASGGWGRYLPLVEDLLSTGVLSRKPVSLTSAYGITRLTPAPTLLRRARGWLALTLGYARYVDLRLRALSSSEPRAQTAFAREASEASAVSIEMVPFEFDAGAPRTLPVPGQLAASTPPRVGPPATSPEAKVGAGMLLLQGALGHEPIAQIHEWWRDVVDYAVSPGGNRIPHLAAYGVVLLGAFLHRAVAIRESIERDRRAIPLVIGGWGTRGKSGTERLKGAMLHGLGYECLVKTTGCEAMFIHAIPSVPAREVFIYRPYDKATVWEQRQILRLARRFGVRAFLWECMALQPDLVRLLQSQWMHDDYSTITNAYPDHEDVQGPSGLDVAATISEFVPVRGTLLTSEDQMLPLLRERARSRSTRLHTVGSREEELVSGDLLARFGHSEHPRNVALAASLAAHLGVPREVAIAEMADNVVPDLGVLKTYPTVRWRGRTVTFTNGMGANDRAGTLGNWRRSGFHAHDVDAEPARWIVTVVNNRADRISRSEVFARLIVQDIGAHRHVLIGTNVGGLLGFIRDALERHVEAVLPSRDLSGDGDERRATARERIVAAFARLKVGATNADSVIAECESLGLPLPPRATVESMLVAPDAAESYEKGLHVVRDGLGSYPHAEALPFVTAMIARRRVVRRVLALADAQVANAPAEVDRAFREAYRGIFMEAIVPLHDPGLSGDAIIDRIAQSVPPGAKASVMGIQNIKGTGLDFVYRWVSVDTLESMLEQLRSPVAESRTSALFRLLAHDGYGLVDSTMVLEAVERARASDPEADARPYDAVVARLRPIVEARTRILSTRRTPRLADRVRKAVGETFDFLDSVWRRRMAERVLDELVEGHISHGAAATRMRAILARTKGAWLTVKADR